MRGVTSVIVQTHQILRLPRKMNLMIDPCHTWNAIYNARTNTCHCPNSPYTAPATKNESHDWSLSHMKRCLQCAEQQVSLSKFTEYCACHAKWLFKISEKFLENSWNVISNARPIRPWSDHDPRPIRPWNRRPQPASQPRLLFTPTTSILYWKIQHFVLRLSFQISPNTAPATKSDTSTSPNTAPATKSDTWTSANTAITWLSYDLTELLLDWATTWLSYDLTELLLDWTITWLSYDLTELLLDWAMTWLSYDSTELWLDWAITWLSYYLTELWLDWAMTWLSCDLTELWLDWTITWLSYYLTELWLDWAVTWLSYDLTELWLDWAITAMTWLSYDLTELELWLDWLSYDTELLLDWAITAMTWLDWAITWLNYYLTELLLDWAMTWLSYDLTELWLDWAITWLSYDLTELWLDWAITWLSYYLTELWLRSHSYIGSFSSKLPLISNTVYIKLICLDSMSVVSSIKKPCRHKPKPILLRKEDWQKPNNVPPKKN